VSGDVYDLQFTVDGQVVYRIVYNVPNGDATRGGDLYQRACANGHGALHTGANRLGPNVSVIPEESIMQHGTDPRSGARGITLEKIRHGKFFMVGGDMPLYSTDLRSMLGHVAYLQVGQPLRQPGVARFGQGEPIVGAVEPAPADQGLCPLRDRGRKRRRQPKPRRELTGRASCNPDSVKDAKALDLLARGGTMITFIGISVGPCHGMPPSDGSKAVIRVAGFRR
jgi:hypothetical protein